MCAIQSEAGCRHFQSYIIFPHCLSEHWRKFVEVARLGNMEESVHVVESENQYTYYFPVVFYNSNNIATTIINIISQCYSEVWYVNVWCLLFFLLYFL